MRSLSSTGRASRDAGGFELLGGVAFMSIEGWWPAAGSASITISGLDPIDRDGGEQDIMGLQAGGW